MWAEYYIASHIIIFATVEQYNPLMAHKHRSLAGENVFQLRTIFYTLLWYKMKTMQLTMKLITYLKFAWKPTYSSAKISSPQTTD